MMSGDLEDGEIEDGEIPEEAGTEVVKASPEDKPQVRITPSPDVVAKQSESATKSEALLVKAKRTSGVTNQKHSGKEDVKGSGLEDDWAGEVEKAIQAALGGKEKGHELPSGAGNEEEDGGERNVRWNKRRKKHQGDEDGSKEPKKMKWSHGIPAEEAMETGQVGSSGDDEDDYDDEMLFVRGASPIMPGNYGSSPHGFHDESGSYKEGGQFEELYDSDYEPDEYMREDSGHKRGGRGGKPRLLGRGGGRGMMKKRPIGLKKPIGSLGKRLLNKRQQQRMGKPPQGSQQTSESICAFFMQGKCQKENECPYSHNALPPRKMELCKFYLMGCCAKKDKCLYMHSDFPCKFFHSGLKCAAGNRCKFSHGNLTESLKDVLLKHLETAPKEILGDFPRERAATMIYNKNCGNKGPWPGAKKIPSLLEIEVPIPPQLLAGNPELRRDDEKPGGRHSASMINSENEVADKDGCRGVMKSSPKMAGRGNIRQWDGDDGARPGDSGEEDIRHKGFHKMFRGRMMPNREPSEEREMPRRPNYQDQDFSEQLQQLKLLFKKEIKNSGENADAEGNTETQHQQRKHHRHGKKRKKKSRDEDQPRSKKSAIVAAVYPEENMEPAELENRTSDGEGAELTDEEGKLEIDVQQEDETVEDEEKGSSPSRADNSAANFQDLKDDIVNADKEQGETDNNSSSCSLEMAGLPHNLPKKQRELFLRIQQQQREAADLNSQDKSGKEDDKEMDEDQQEESWYSSDEEEASLADVLKNLSKQESSKSQQQEQQKPPSPSRTPPLPPPGSTSTLLDGIKLSDINISEPISKLLSIIQQTTSASNVGHTVETSESRSNALSHMPKEPTAYVRDPRLASAEAHRRSANVNSMSPNAHENPRQDPRISKRASSRSQGHRTSIYSSTVLPSAGSVMQDPGESSSDVDMKNMHISQSNTSFELGTNVDPRTNRASSSSSSTSLPYALGDLDSMDMKGSLGLPFKPVPMHKPATEIDASLTSHPPIQYKVIPITIPWPDYSRLKLNVSDVQIRNDPRLRKLFKMSGSSSKRQSSPPPPPPPSSPPPVPKQSPSNIARNDPRRRSAPMSPHSSMSPRIQETPPGYPDMMSHNPMGPPQNPMGIAQNPMGIAQNPMGPGQNPMGLMHNPNMPSGMVPGMSSGLNFDPRLPRNPRNAPGLLGPAPLPYNYCPSTPKCDDMEDGNGPNPDPRMFYNQPPMDMQQHQPRNQGMHRNRTWKNNRKNQRRFRPHQQERSFTPPI